MIRAAAVSAFVVSILAFVPSFHSSLDQTAANPVTPGRRHAIVRPDTKLPPVAAADSYFITQNATLGVGTPGILGNDTLNDSAEIASYGAATGAEETTLGTATPTAQSGSVTVNSDGSISYTPPANFIGTDSFQYVLTNPEGTSSALVTLTVLAPPPIALGDSYNVEENGTLAEAAAGVLANDVLNGAVIVSYGAPTGAEESTLGTATATAQSGSVTLNADGSFNYTPAAGFTGTDSFLYVLMSSVGSSTGQVTLTVIAPPNARNDSYSTPQGATLNVGAATGVLANDVPNSGVIVSYGPSSGFEQTTLGTSEPTGQNGSVLLNIDGSFVYMPPAGFTGSDSFLYDVENAVAHSVATVTITVQAPAGPDFTVTTPNDQHAYKFTGSVTGTDPDLTLVQGRTYTFKISASSDHPFEILQAPSGSVTGNTTTNGTVTFVVPMGSGSYRYHCAIHNFGGAIKTVAP